MGNTIINDFYLHFSLGAMNISKRTKQILGDNERIKWYYRWLLWLLLLLWWLLRTTHIFTYCMQLVWVNCSSSQHTVVYCTCLVCKDIDSVISQVNASSHHPAWGGGEAAPTFSMGVSLLPVGRFTKHYATLASWEPCKALCNCTNKNVGWVGIGMWLAWCMQLHTFVGLFSGCQYLQ